MDLGSIIAIGVGFLILASSLAGGWHRVSKARLRVEGVARRKAAQSERIRKLGRHNLAARRELRQARLRAEELRREVTELDTRLTQAASTEKRIYVLDEKRLAVDIGWIVTVRNPSYSSGLAARAIYQAVASWREGRQFLVWAPDEKGARLKAQARLPEMKGFSLVSVVPESPQALPAKAKAKASA